MKQSDSRKEIRIYVEGAGKSSDEKANFRRGWGIFLKQLVDAARERRIRWYTIPCGGRGEAFRNFCKALRSHPHAFNVLLVDSEGPVSDCAVWNYLEQHDGWNRPKNVRDDQCFLMVQAMEAWVIADHEALKQYYGQHFHSGSLPNVREIENVSATNLVEALNKAVQTTSKKKYHKMRHACDLLASVNVAAVRVYVPHCERLFAVLMSQIEEMASGESR